MFLAELLIGVALIGLADWICDLLGLGVWIKFVLFGVVIAGFLIVDQKFVHSRFPKVIEDGAQDKKAEIAVLKRWLVSVAIFLGGMLIYMAADRLKISHRLKMVMDIGLLVASYFPAYKMAPEHYHKVKKFLWTISALLFACAVMIVIIAVEGAVWTI